MAKPSTVISGLAVTMTAGGLVLIYSGLRNATVADTIRSLIKGQPVPSLGSAIDAARSAVMKGSRSIAGPTITGGKGTDVLGTSAGGSATGNAVADDARKYLGAPYVFGAHGPNEFDCSGLVTWVLHHDFGLDLPDNTHTVTGQFYVWTGAVTVPKDQCQAGDLVCWASHIGIATGPKTMINAPQPGEVVKEQAIWWFPEPSIRRPKAYGPKALKGTT